MMSLVSTATFAYTIYLFNITRYIKLSYTVIALALETFTILIMALAITLITIRDNIARSQSYLIDHNNNHNLIKDAKYKTNI